MIGAITSLYVLNTVIVAMTWSTVLKVLAMNAHPSPLATAYTFAVSGTDLVEYIQLICKFLLVVIADGLIVSADLHLDLMY